ncbi:MAG: hypothetical protein HY741_23925 [Chloroflexi bacterium]|nr:hypothetical protein [Chloroflexota bacterium]
MQNKKWILGLVVVLTIGVFAARVAMAAPRTQTTSINNAYPLAKGVTWKYEAKVKYDANGKTLEKTLPWTVTVKDVIERGSVRVYVMSGALGDLAFYSEGKKPGDYLLVEIAPNRFYTARMDDLKKFQDPDDILAGVVSDENVVLDLPLVTDKRFCAADYITRSDGAYCWIVGDETIANLQAKGVPANAQVAYPLTYQTNADRTTIQFVAGLGIAEYHYEHFGTPAQVDAKLTEYIAGAPAAASTASGKCELVVTKDVTAYTRPSLQADKFADLQVGDTLEFSAMTADGWFGFEPGVAQAANVGPFRLRWVQATDALKQKSACKQLPVVASLSPTACYQMFMDATPILSEAKKGASVVANAKAEDYAQVIAANDQWLQLDLEASSLNVDQKGWIARDDANFNGDCDNLPKPAASSFTDPFAYCSAVGTIDTPDVRYTGPNKPDAVVRGLMKAMGLAPDAPTEPFMQATFWRCMSSKVYACTVGANIPCQEKADLSKTPSAAMNDYCKANPASDFIPAYVTGRATVYEWKCVSGKPEAGKQLFKADARGFIADFWYEISK